MLVRWFGGNTAAASQFAAFGAAGDGLMYAYWLRDSRDASRSPIVFLAHGGDESLVLACSTEEFLSLLGIGYKDLGYDFRGKPPGPDRRWFRNWLWDRLRIRPAESAQTVIAKATPRSGSSAVARGKIRAKKQVGRSSSCPWTLLGQAECRGHRRDPPSPGCRAAGTSPGADAAPIPRRTGGSGASG